MLFFRSRRTGLRIGRASTRGSSAVAVAALTLAALGAQDAVVGTQSSAKRPLSIVGLAELPRVLDAQLSPDGRSVVYTLTRADWKANRPVPHIWRQPIGGGAPIQLTNGDAGETSARWSPDSQSILFLTRKADTETQIYRLPLSGDEAQPLSRHATAVSQPTWAPDGSAVYFLATDARSSEERERERLRDDVFALDENFRQRHL